MADDPTKPPHWHEANKGKAKEAFNRAAARPDDRTQGGGSSPPGAPPIAASQKSKFVKDMPGPVGQAARREQEKRQDEPAPQPAPKVKPPKGRDGPSL